MIGYARVSTSEQNLDLQITALRASGCTKFYTDHGVSGADFERQGLSQVLKNIGPGDMLVVWRLDRLGRSLVDLTAW
jgi:DNA invertase Pin-like site-specific DNA recombinase